VLERISAACRRSGRPDDAVTLVAVSKTVSLERLSLAVVAGHDRFGENRVQEAADKVRALPAAEWHLVGRLQANKAARAAGLFDVVESVDSLPLARRLAELAGAGRARAGQRLPVYLQVNVDEDPAKAGFPPVELETVLSEVLDLPGLEVLGLMTVGWHAGGGEAARPTFARLRDLAERARAADPRLGPGLSMGMSDDYEVAVEEGSTLVRVGRALLGERPSAG
jgi:pyridoxal phosphate enzyme (YggS family)